MSELAPELAIARAPWWKVLLLAPPVLILGAGALLVPGWLAWSLVRQGAAKGHPSWIALGALIGALYLLLIYVTARPKRTPR